MLKEHRLLTVGEVALRLRQSERTVRDKIAAGALPAIRIGEGPRAPIRIPEAELEAWLSRDIGADLRAETPPSAAHPPRGSRLRRRPRGNDH